MSPVLNLQMVSDQLVIATKNNVYVYNIVNGFSMDHDIKTCDNVNGTCVVRADDNMFMLATLGKTKGMLRIDEYRSKFTVIIQAFEKAIQNVSISLNVIYIHNIRES